MSDDRPRPRGRGARDNVSNQYECLHIDVDPGALDEEERRSVETTLWDPATSILSENESPDVPYTYSLNPYRGCEHGCPYCLARPTHEYWGLSAGLDFETTIFVKEEAPRLLGEMAEQNLVTVAVSLTSVDDELAGKLEPRSARPPSASA